MGSERRDRSLREEQPLKKATRGLVLCLVFPMLWFGLFMLGPYILMFAYSFATKSYLGFDITNPTFENWIRFLTTPAYRTVLFRSLYIGLIVGVLANVFAFPVAYFLSFHASQRMQKILYVFVIIPLWASYLIRAYAWKTVLGVEGVINSFLINYGFVSEPLGLLLYSKISVCLGLLQFFTPFCILSQFSSMKRIPQEIVKASSDLGAGTLKTLYHVILPLDIPGILAGGTIAFSLSFGGFIAPILLGGPNDIMIANILMSQYGTAFDWPLGSAIGLTMFSVAMVVLFMAGRIEDRYKRYLEAS